MDKAQEALAEYEMRRAAAGDKAEVAHTPTPWVVKEVATSAGTCFRVGPQHIVDMNHGGMCLYDDHYQHNPHASGEQRANAAFIVRACNLYEDLVAALKASEETDEERQSFSELEKVFRDRGCAIPDESDYEYYRRSRQRELIAKAGSAA